jgi:hypothetical protein
MLLLWIHRHSPFMNSISEISRQKKKLYFTLYKRFHLQMLYDNIPYFQPPTVNSFSIIAIRFRSYCGQQQETLVRQLGKSIVTLI